ncbi:MAG TPA: amino acid adenylation domain-containing protein [Terriglobia bacterium]|nr:amino acid adenylation domain-containing protein [Terriglobia bacterium]
MLLQHIVRDRAQRQPEATACVGGGKTVTYQGLEESGNRLARLLKAAGCERGDRVALLTPKSIRAVIGMLGALKAECVYVPMDTASPAARLAKIIRAADPKCVLVVDSTLNLLNELRVEGCLNDARVGSLDEGAREAAGAVFGWDDLLAVSPRPLDCGTSPDAAAHILFTSGSTGTPKGVVITHANVIAFLQWASGYFASRETDRISCHPPLHFDLSTFDIWGTFLSGAQLYLVPPEISLLPHRLAEFIRTNELTQWFSVPSALRYMAQFDVVRPGDFPCLQRLLWCGEALPTRTLMYWMSRLPHVTFTNLYGPTETTIASSFYTVPRCPENERSEIPIGRPCDGEDLMVLDESLQPVEAGNSGDLYIHGVGLSPGYWRDLEKTRDAFLEDTRFGRIYKTGDLATVGEDGLVYLLGRKDSQIKSRGYRIELGEIETAINSLGAVRECAVVAVDSDGFEGAMICCAYAPQPGMEIAHSDLRQSLSRILPAYMLPSRWIALDPLPLNANGKIDRPHLRSRFLAMKTAA